LIKAQPLNSDSYLNTASYKVPMDEADKKGKIVIQKQELPDRLVKRWI
jgi:hypothetical protein